MNTARLFIHCHEHSMTIHLSTIHKLYVKIFHISLFSSEIWFSYTASEIEKGDNQFSKYVLRIRI